jgi:hypothetical protein
MPKDDYFRIQYRIREIASRDIVQNLGTSKNYGCADLS